jgi:hypothetical protein
MRAYFHVSGAVVRLFTKLFFLRLLFFFLSVHSFGHMILGYRVVDNACALYLYFHR